MYVCLSVDPYRGPLGCCGVPLHRCSLQLLQKVLQQKWWQGHPRHEVQWHAYCEFNVHIDTHSPSTYICLLSPSLSFCAYLYNANTATHLLFYLHSERGRGRFWQGSLLFKWKQPHVLFHQVFFSIKWWTLWEKTAPEASAQPFVWPLKILTPHCLLYSNMDSTVTHICRRMGSKSISMKPC